jgi:hypothetical protein
MFCTGIVTAVGDTLLTLFVMDPCVAGELRAASLMILSRFGATRTV